MCVTFLYSKFWLIVYVCRFSFTPSFLEIRVDKNKTKVFIERDQGLFFYFNADILIEQKVRDEKWSVATTFSLDV